MVALPAAGHRGWHRKARREGAHQHPVQGGRHDSSAHGCAAVG